jgi:hypothetical protein
VSVVAGPHHAPGVAVAAVTRKVGPAGSWTEPGTNADVRGDDPWVRFAAAEVTQQYGY